MKLNFLDRFWKNIQIADFKNIRPVGTKLFHVDRQTWMKLLLFTILQMRPKTVIMISH